MLTQLRIQNFITIKDFSCEFHHGLTVFTGESGTGKSVIFSALYCLLGKSFPESLIRTGASVSECEAVFNIKDYHDTFLNSFSDDDETLILFRQQSHDKTAQIKVNSRTVTQKTLKEIGKRLAIIVSQHEHLSLMNHSYQLKLLDQLNPELVPLKANYKHLYEDYLSKKKVLTNFQASHSDPSKIDFFQFQYDDINQHGFSADEEQDLLARKKNYTSLESTKKALNTINSSFNRALPDLQQAYSTLTSINHDSLNHLTEPLQQHIHELEDISFSVSQSQKEFTTDHPLSINDIEKRLDLIFTYTSKYNVLSLQQLCVFRDELKTTLDSSKNAAKHLEILQADLQDSIAKLREQSDQIHAIRIASASHFKHDIIPILTSLGFETIDFDINFISLNDFSSTGLDQVEFMIRINAGEPLKPLSNIASGGELSRILLAIFSLFPNSYHKQLYLFDEIDTGIGGMVANAMGKQLHDIAKNQQLFCITHLAQIASCANHHLVISKTTSSTSTQTECHYLEQTDKALELKRMVGGESLIQTIA
ncbi:hypothetical protein CL647_05535 [bacterium]|nr:hypothetical protein [Actinomycetota bacterium]MBE33546.1 hypothetical protein [bacterium]|tara:strand:- start:2883 stop:4490 length:1608 start_codon:yes stop_codon:yes gene_type:complete